MAIFPTGKVDADQLKGQRTVGLVVTVIMLVFVLAMKTTGPGLFFEGAPGVFVKALAPELWTAPPNVNGSSGTTLSDDWRDAIELSHFSSTLKALPIGAEGH